MSGVVRDNMVERIGSRSIGNVAVVGLGVMGLNLARNLARQEGNRVVVLDRSCGKIEEAVNQHPEACFVPAYSFRQLVGHLKAPRIVILMVPAGRPAEDAFNDLLGELEPGDVIIDGGNSHYEDTARRQAKASARGLHLLGVGVSGGQEGALSGPSIMPGGDVAAWEVTKPILEGIAARVDGHPCVTYVGPGGAGHFVKAVHNGIEYADMQLIAEAYHLIREVTAKSPAEIAEIFSEWNRGELDSFLIEITAKLLKHTDSDGNYLVDVICDKASAKGTGAWTVKAALELGVDVSGIAGAVFARLISAETNKRLHADKLAGPSTSLVRNPDQFIESVKYSLFAGKIVSYSQGFGEIAAAGTEFGWNFDLAAIARIWRGGCIIRARLLDRIAEAYEVEPHLALLLADDYFAAALSEAQLHWRKVVGVAVGSGIPTPTLSALLTYYDALRSERLPTALIQAQRDYFGAHTYRRIDRPGAFHVDWAESEKEMRVG